MVEGRWIDYVRGADGEVRIEGQDLGSAVERIMGEGIREYEWTWVIDAEAVGAAVKALGGDPDDDVLDLLKAWAATHGDADPGTFLRDAGVPMAFWNRMGD